MKENTEKIMEMMKSSISEVFNKMFFIFLEPLDNENIEADMEAAVSFDGTISGEVRILLSREIVGAMIKNMLNLGEEEFAIHDIKDCSKEAVNMVCGNLLSKFDSSARFGMNVPVFREVPEKIEPSENVLLKGFDSDEGKLGMVVTLSE